MTFTSCNQQEWCSSLFQTRIWNYLEYHTLQILVRVRHFTFLMGLKPKWLMVIIRNLFNSELFSSLMINLLERSFV